MYKNLSPKFLTREATQIITFTKRLTLGYEFFEKQRDIFVIITQKYVPII